MSFLSDNCAGAHPDVLAAVAAANVGHAPSYGADAVTRRLEERAVELLGDCAIFPVLLGTGANVTALATLLRPHEAVVCAATAHINVDEGGAPERFLGAKLIDVETPAGKLTPALVEGAVRGRGDEHHVQARIVSITQSTELGTVYGIAELRELADAVHALDLLLHVDGARLANAAASLNVELRELAGAAGVDVLSLGGTKNGALAAEAVVFCDRALAGSYRYARKQGMQLASKMRFVSAQLLALYDGDLWRRNALQANAMAARLAEGLRGLGALEIVQPVEANAVFARISPARIGALQEVAAFHVMDEKAHVARLMCAWDTEPPEVDEFVAAARAICA